MSTDHPGRPFRYGIRFKIAVSIGVIMVALMAVDILWNLSLQNAQAENEAREKAEVLASEMRAAWDFVDMNQDVINRAEDGTFRTKHLVCVVAAKSISMLFTTETDYSIRFTNDTPRQAANAPDEFEQEALAALDRMDLAQYTQAHPLALSGGQKQRLAIVDGCLSGKELLIFDEPTSGLDYAHMLEVSRLLRELAKQGLCVVVITHDGEFLRESGAQTAEWVPKEQLQ